MKGGFTYQIADLSQSPNYAIRRTARMVIERISCKLNDECSVPTSSNTLSLPLIYWLSIPFVTQIPPAELEIIDGEPLPDSYDSIEIIRPFDVQIDFIAREAKLPTINMCYRVVQIMRQLAPQESWSAQGEKDLRMILSSARMKYSFRRPRATIARRAMYHVIAELIDAGLLGPENLSRLDTVLRFYDPTMVMAEPTRRPIHISPILDYYGGFRKT